MIKNQAILESHINESHSQHKRRKAARKEETVSAMRMYQSAQFNSLLAT